MVISVNQGEEKNLWKEQMKTHSKNKQTARSVRKCERVANAFDFVHCTWLVESVARVFSYSINVEKEKPKQRRVTFKALFD